MESKGKTLLIAGNAEPTVCSGAKISEIGES